MLKAWRAYKALNDEQRQIIEQKQVKVHRPIDEAIALLKPIADMDKMMASGCAVALTMFLIIVAAVVFQVIAEASNWPAAPRGVFFLLCVAAFVGILVMYLRMRRIDVSDNLRVSALPMLYVFREDVDPRTPMELTLDLRPPMSKEKLLREEKPRERLKEKFYGDEWMSADAMLVDGSRLRWSVTDTIRERTQTKKGRSGKWKTKTKVSKKSNVFVELTVRNKSYEVSGGEAGEKKTTLTSTRRMKHAGADPVDPKNIIEVITDLFQKVSPAK